MEAVRILRLLWRRRLLVAGGLVLAMVVGISIAYRVSLGFPPKIDSRQYHVGIASANALVDSPSSQTVDLAGGASSADIGALTTRARLLANIMVASPLKDDIARTAGIDPGKLGAIAPSIEPSGSPKPSTIDSPKSGPRANILTVYFNETLPIITADAQAPDEATAARISSAAVTQLGNYLKSVGALDKVPDAHRLVVEPLGPARSATVERGTHQLVGVIALLLVFALWCAAIVAVDSVARRWRAVAQEEVEDGLGSEGQSWQRYQGAGVAGRASEDEPAYPLAVAYDDVEAVATAPSHGADDAPEERTGRTEIDDLEWAELDEGLELWVRGE